MIQIVRDLSPEASPGSATSARSTAAIVAGGGCKGPRGGEWQAPPSTLLAVATGGEEE
jgi:hypothetical protein